MIGDNRLAFALHDGPGLPDPESGFRFLLRELVYGGNVPFADKDLSPSCQFGLALRAFLQEKEIWVKEYDLLARRGEETILRKRPGVGKVVRLRDIFDAFGRVGAQQG